MYSPCLPVTHLFSQVNPFPRRTLENPRTSYFARYAYAHKRWEYRSTCSPGCTGYICFSWERLVPGWHEKHAWNRHVSGCGIRTIEYQPNRQLPDGGPHMWTHIWKSLLKFWTAQFNATCIRSSFTCWIHTAPQLLLSNFH